MSIQHKITWVIIADGEQAHFFTRTSQQRLLPMPYGKMRVIDNYAHRLENIDQDIRLARTKTDYANQFEGRTHDRIGYGSHRLEPHSGLHEYEESVFLRNVAKHINDAEIHNKFDKIILVAPPYALGILRKELSANVSDKIFATVKKELAHIANDNLSYVEKHLQDVL